MRNFEKVKGKWKKTYFTVSSLMIVRQTLGGVQPLILFLYFIFLLFLPFMFNCFDAFKCDCFSMLNFIYLFI